VATADATRPILTTVWQANRHIRVSTMRLNDGDTSGSAVQFAENLAPVDAEKRRLAILLSFLLPASWLVAGVAGSILTRRSLAPVRSLNQAAQALKGGDLGQRLPVEGTDEMSQLARTINGFLAQSEASYRRLETFVADASHELKSPLTTILLRSSGDSDRSPEMESVYRAAVGMRRTVEDLLLLAKLDTENDVGQTDLDLGNLVGEVADDTVATLGDRLVLNVEAGVVVKGSRPLLKRIVTNLIENAARHAGLSAEIVVYVTSHDGQPELTVKDDGVGIAPHHLSQIFDRFYRVDPVRTHDENWSGQGSGLGLSIVQSIAQAHGATVVLKSTPFQGTEVHVVFPGSYVSEGLLNSGRVAS
jgi:two-component system OmpR family sensor kinase